MDEFRAFIDEVKDKADLLREIQETGVEYAFETARRGKYIYGKVHDSLALDVEWQQYTWFSKSGAGGHAFETGDVFDWLERYRGMDFWVAATYLADRYGVRIPDLRSDDHSERAKSYQARGGLFSTVHEWLVKQLWASPAALDYCRRADGGRAWADETICWKVMAEEALVQGSPYAFSDETVAAARAVAPAAMQSVIVARGAGLGFCPGTAQSAADLSAWLEMHGIEMKAPATVAIVGLKAHVAAWCRDHAIDAQSNWLEHDRIYGLVDFPRLIYPHFGRGGRPVYFSARNLKQSGSKLISEPDKKRKSWNPPEQLVGQRMWFFNWLFHKNAEEVVIVEGQADAITLGEWGLPAIALNGLAADQGLATVVKDVRKRFLALDADRAGREAMMEVAQIFGPKVRLLEWSTAGGTSAEDFDAE